MLMNEWFCLLTVCLLKPVLLESLVFSHLACCDDHSLLSIILLRWKLYYIYAASTHDIEYRTPYILSLFYYSYGFLMMADWGCGEQEEQCCADDHNLSTTTMLRRWKLVYIGCFGGLHIEYTIYIIIILLLVLWFSDDSWLRMQRRGLRAGGSSPTTVLLAPRSSWRRRRRLRWGCGVLAQSASSHLAVPEARRVMHLTLIVLLWSRVQKLGS